MMNIRHITSKDFTSIRQIEHQCFPSKERCSKEKLWKRLLRNMEETYILELNGKIISYLSGEEIDGFLFIHTLACLKEYQNQGYGTMLLSEAKKDALKKNRKGLRPLSKEKNIQYYQHFGFKEVTYESPSWHMMELDMEETKK